MATNRIRYLASIINTLKLACRFLPLAVSTVRPRIPAEQRAQFDTGSAAVQAFCEFLQTIDYIGDDIGEG